MSEEKQVNLCEGCNRPIESNIYACDDCVANLDIDLHMCPEFRKDKAEIKELEEKLSLYEWKDIKDIEAEIYHFPKGQRFDLWVEERCPYQGCLVNSHRVPDCYWVNSLHKWRCSLDRKVERENIAITHGRAAPTPPTQEGEE